MTRDDSDRRTGRTTRQMQAAPLNAVFISCHHGALSYDHGLAQKHERGDLQVMSSSWLTNRAWEGTTLSGIVLDHDLHLTAGERDAMEHAVTHVRRTT